MRFAVERNFILIGEAMVLLRRNYPEMSRRIEEEARVIGFRNLLVHQYWNVDHTEVWSIIVSKVAPLGDVVDRLLADLSPNAS